MIVCTAFKESKKDYLEGFATLQADLEGKKIVMNNCALFNKDGNRWLNLPTHPYKDKDGETKYGRNIVFVDFEDQKKFSADALSAVLKFIGGDNSKKKEIDDFFQSF